MTGFAIGATLLVAIAVAFLLWPFRRRPAGADFSRQQLTAAIYRDEFAELDRDLAEGLLSAEDHAQARTELQRRLLEDSEAPAPGSAAAPASRAMPVALVVGVPIVAVLLYTLIGSPAAIDPPPPEQKFTADDIDKMVTGLAAKLAQEPDNLQGWAMLARSYKAMGRFDDAVNAYRRSGKLLDENADLLIDYADTLAASLGGFDAKVLDLIERALKLDPQNMQGLWLRGSAALAAQRYEQAIGDWDVLLKLLPPGSQEAGMVEANIAEARTRQAAGTQKP